MTPYEQGAEIARTGGRPPPFPKGDATWAARLINLGFVETRDQLNKEHRR